MKKWFELPEAERKLAIEQTSADIALPPAAIEKDLWVVIVLDALFKSDISGNIVFKGGTSLSKGWGLIQRFSEDIDLAIDRSFFGFNEEIIDPKEVTKLRKKCCSYMEEQFVPKLKGILEGMGVQGFDISVLEHERSDADPVAIEIKYKSDVERIAYINPRILIEISSRSLREPCENIKITSFISDKFPKEEYSNELLVPTVVPARTLLEKLFLLHEEFQKPEDRPIRSERMSRHLYDIGKLMDTKHLEIALSDFELFRHIVRHRETLTKVTWVDYSKHFPPNLSFIPPERVMNEWEKDYLDMKESMFYGETDEFTALMEKLKSLNERINLLEIAPNSSE